MAISMNQLISFFLVLGFISSCSNKTREITIAKLVIGAAIGTPETAGGMMIYGKNQTTNETFAKQVLDENTTLELSNGNWDFIGVTWDGLNGPMTGVPRCADVEGILLSGGDISVALTFNTTNCSESVFGAGSFAADSSGWPDLSVISCGNLFDADDLGAKPSELTGGVQQCLSTTSSNPSFQVVLPQGELSPDFSIIGADGVTSACADFNIAGSFISSTTASGVSIDIQVPYFNAFEGAGVPTRIILYEGPGCTGPSESFLFASSLSGPGPVGAVYDFAGAKTAVVRGNICAGARIDPLKYQVTEAVATPDLNPICTPEQLSNISTSMAHNQDKNFILVSNIDLSGVGDFTPFMIGDIATPYTGDFFGRGRTISNLSITSSATPGVGLFGIIGSGANIDDINLIGVEIDSADDGQVGALVGDAEPGSSIRGAHVENVTITASATALVNNIGGVVGRVDNANIEFIEARNISIEVEDHSSVGGIIGHLNNSVTNSGTGFKISSIENISIQRIGANNISDIGGAVGLVQESGLYQIEARGVDILLTDASNVGGIFGRFVANSVAARDADITGLFADGIIDLTKVGGAANFVGGIGGYIDGDVMESYYTTLYSDVDITTDNGGTGDFIAGGIFGQLLSSTDRINTLVAAKNTGDITCGGNKCGGIIGVMGPGGSPGNTTLYGAYNSGVIDGGNLTSIGGLVGEATGNIVSSLNKGAISSSGGLNIGGLIGSAINGKTVNSINTANITGTGSDVGGFSGTSSATVSFKKTVNLGTISGTTNANPDFGAIAGTCGATAILSYTTTGTPLCATAGEVDVVSAPTASTDFPNLSFVTDSPGGSVGNASLSPFGSLVGGAGMDFNTDLDLGEFVIFTGSPDLLELPLVRVTTAAAASTLFGNGSNIIADTPTVVLGPWVYHPINGLSLNAEALADLFTPNQLGIQNKPILIDTPEKFNLVASENYLMDKDFKLANDIDFGNGAFTPFANSVYPYTGTFNGNNRALRNITINEPTKDNVGVFSSLGSNARIDGYDDDTDEDAILYLDNLTVVGQNHVGALVGFVQDNTTIANVMISNSVVTGSNFVGGLIGSLNSNSGFSRVTGLVNNLTEVNQVGSADIGGLIGGLIGAITSNASIEIKGLFSNGDVDGIQNVGGLIGNIQGSSPLTLDYAGVENGNVNATGAAGGLIGSTAVATTINDSFVKNQSIITTGGDAAGLIGSASAASSIYSSFVRDTSIAAATNAGIFISSSANNLNGFGGYSFNNTLAPSPSPKHFSAVGTLGIGAIASDVTNEGSVFTPGEFFEGAANPTLDSTLGLYFTLRAGTLPGTRRENDIGVLPFRN